MRSSASLRGSRTQAAGHDAGHLAGGIQRICSSKLTYFAEPQILRNREEAPRTRVRPPRCSRSPLRAPGPGRHPGWHALRGGTEPSRLRGRTETSPYAVAPQGSGCLLSGRCDRNSDGAAHALALVPDVEMSGELPGDRLPQQTRTEAWGWLGFEHGPTQLTPVDG
jgi:hypothetical protein